MHFWNMSIDPPRPWLDSITPATPHVYPVIEKHNMFYPYGASRADCWLDSAMVQRWKYSGKELDSFQGLHCYDYGFRWYDPIVCRLTTPDPMREKYYDISAYAFCGNNPVNIIDLEGCKIKGVSKNDASKVVIDFQSMFLGDEFEQFRSLIKTNGRKELTYISMNDLNAALNGIVRN